jgi:hypothetical protein
VFLAFIQRWENRNEPSKSGLGRRAHIPWYSARPATRKTQSCFQEFSKERFLFFKNYYFSEIMISLFGPVIKNAGG